MKEIIQKLIERIDLTHGEATTAMTTIMEGRSTDAQTAAFLIALKLKGERTHEVQAFAEVMREKALPVSIDDPDAVDMCGTGGDGSGTFNISTAASFVVAGAGVTVAKHGNRSNSSLCGSAEVLKTLGVNIGISPERVGPCINEIGIGFLFAPLFHPAMKHAAKARLDLGVKTCFNMLGPMTNPAGVRRQLVGTFSHEAAQIMAAVFSRSRAAKVFVIHAQDGLDEISLETATTVFEVDDRAGAREYSVDSGQLGLPPAKASDLRGGSAGTNASIILNILYGEKGPRRDVVVANAAFGLMAAGRARTPREGVGLASESIDSGKALEKLHQLREITNR